MDTKQYRKRIEQSVAKVQARDLKSATRSRTEDLSRVVGNKKTPPKTRAEALGRMTRAGGPGAVPQAALQRLADPQESPVVRLAAIKLLQQLQIFSPVAAEWRPAFVEALRAAVRDPKVRAAALEVLSLLKDRPTQELLLEGIRSPKEALVPLQEALRLLSTDVHADAIAVARELTSTGQLQKNKAALVQAVRILAADPASIGTLERVLASDAYPVEARRLAATAISHLSPDALPKAQPAPRSRRARSTARSKTAAKNAAKPKGDLAKHLETLQRVRG